MKLVSIDLLSLKGDLIFRTEEGKKKVKDPIRKKFIILTPEEYVRQLLLLYLTTIKQISSTRILVEKEIKIAEKRKRFDIVVVDQAQQPLLLVECKSHKHKLTQSVFNQASRYNLSLVAPYLMISNGMENCIAKIDFDTKKFSFMNNFPDL